MSEELKVNLEQMLSFEFWELHEAAYILSSWPNNIILSGIPLPTSKQINRTFLYTTNGRLNKKNLPLKTQKLLFQLKKSVEDGELFAFSRNLLLYRFYGRNVSYILRSNEVVLWALLKGLFLPLDLQKAIKIYQIKASRNKDLTNKVKNQTTGQYLISKNPHLNVSKMCEHEWFLLFGTAKESKDFEKRAIRRALNELFDSKGQKGRPSTNSPQKKGRKYKQKALTDIRREDADGLKYNIQLLQIAIAAATKINIHFMELNKLSRMTENDFVNHILSDDVINLYLDKAPSSIINLIKKFILNELVNYYPHYKIQNIPAKIRKDLKIGELQFLNQEFCLEPFTPEEKSLIKQNHK